jgi:Membrane protease subunits, stomatin/prohibitin homologs
MTLDLTKIKKSRKLILSGVIVLAVIILIAASVTIIPAGYKGIMLNMGAVTDKVLDEGINFRIPFIQSIRTMDVRMQKYESADNSSASKDLQSIKTTIAVNYRVDSASVDKLYKNIGMSYETMVISPAISECIKAVTSQYTAEELITKRTEVSAAMKDFLQSKLTDKYILVDSFNVVNFEFSDAFNKAIEEKQIAEQNALKAKYDLERIKTEADQEITKAQGDAEAMRLKNSQVTDKIIQLEFLNKWDGKMPTYYGGGNLLLGLNMQEGTSSTSSTTAP